MNKDRLQQLLEMLKEEPNDPFLIYAIATEYKTEQPNIALTYFDQLLEKHEDYVATYYHAAELLADLEQIERAKQIYEKGLGICEKMNDMHALRELKNAYQNFQFEWEDEL